MLPARHRLTERADFTATMRGPGSRRRSTRLLVVHARATEPATRTDDTDARAARPSRVGLVVSKAVGNSVTRHRVARRLRHEMAALLPLLPPGTDVVLRANPPAASASSADLREALRSGLADLVKDS